jgi:hypothetical protein
MTTRFQNRYAAGGLFAIIGAIFFLFAQAGQWQHNANADHLTDIRLHGTDVSVQVTKVYFHPGSQTASMSAQITALDNPPPAKLPAAVTVGPEYGRELLRQVAGVMAMGGRVTITLRHLQGGEDYLPVDDPEAWKAPVEDTSGFMVIGGLAIAIGMLVFIFYDRMVRKPAA